MLKKNKLGFFEVADKPSISELSEYYQNKYYQEAKGSYELKYSDSELEYFNAKLSRIHFLINQYQNPESEHSLLDIGCGEGFGLQYFATQGFSVTGLDFSNAGICMHNPDFEGHVEVGDLFDLISNKIDSSFKYDVVLLQNVLEHVLEPLQLLSIIKRLLKPHGLVVITVPNDFSITQHALLRNGCITREFWVCPPDHLSYFNFESLKNVLLASDFHIHDLIADFPVDWYLFNSTSNYILNPSKGKEAHLARVVIENMLQDNDIKDVVSFYRSLAVLGAGRDLTAVVSINENCLS